MGNTGLLVLLAALSMNVWAAEEKSEGQSTIKIEDAADKKNKVEGNIDEEITNAKMRAESGSKSKFSLSSDLSYTGGTFSRPFGTERPNLSGEPGMQEQTSASIGLSGRYRWTKNQSVTLGTSAGLMTPFQGDTSRSENQLNVFDPSIAYNLVGKIGSLQTNNSISLTAGTSNEAQSVDRMGSVSIGANVLKVIDKLTIGMAFDAGYTQYDTKPGKLGGLAKMDPDTRAGWANYYGGDKRTQWNLGLYPYMEYAFNDTVSARTVFGYFNWRHVYGDTERYRLLQTFVYQSVGVGVSVTRDIYLYPNVQFVPDNIRGDFTNVAMSATLNVF